MTVIDPIALEVLWSRLLSVTNEQQAALMRTAFSTVVRESQDLAWLERDRCLWVANFASIQFYASLFN